jgi:hypothetical protein
VHHRTALGVLVEPCHEALVDLQVVEALVDPRAERDEPFGGGRVVLLDRGLAQVVGLHQEVPDLLWLFSAGGRPSLSG